MSKRMGSVLDALSSHKPESHRLCSRGPTRLRRDSQRALAYLRTESRDEEWCTLFLCSNKAFLTEIYCWECRSEHLTLLGSCGRRVCPICYTRYFAKKANRAIEKLGPQPEALAIVLAPPRKARRRWRGMDFSHDFRTISDTLETFFEGKPAAYTAVHPNGKRRPKTYAPHFNVVVGAVGLGSAGLPVRQVLTMDRGRSLAKTLARALLIPGCRASVEVLPGQDIEKATRYILKGPEGGPAERYRFQPSGAVLSRQMGALVSHSSKFWRDEYLDDPRSRPLGLPRTPVHPSILSPPTPQVSPTWGVFTC